MVGVELELCSCYVIHNIKMLFTPMTIVIPNTLNSLDLLQAINLAQYFKALSYDAI